MHAHSAAPPVVVGKTVGEYKPSEANINGMSSLVMAGVSAGEFCPTGPACTLGADRLSRWCRPHGGASGKFCTVGFRANQRASPALRSSPCYPDSSVGECLDRHVISGAPAGAGGFTDNERSDSWDGQTSRCYETRRPDAVWLKAKLAKDRHALTLARRIRA